MKLKDFMFALKNGINYDPKGIYDTVICQVETDYKNKKSLHFKWIAGGAATLLILISVSVFCYHFFKFDTSNNLTGDTASLSKLTYVAADHIKDNGAATNADITIVTKESMSIAQLKNHLSVTPETSYTIQKTGTNRFSLSFDSVLEDNTSYTINSKIGDSIVYRWSIQTNAPFGIDQVTPADKTNQVNCASDIHVTFSESGVNGFEEYFSIYPDVKGSFTHKGRIWTFSPSSPLSPCTNYTVTISGEIYGNDEIPLGKDYVFSFTTDKNEDKYAYIFHDDYDIADAYTTAQTPSFMMIAKGMTGNIADMKVYKLTDENEYLNLHRQYGHDAILSTSIGNQIKDKGYQIHSQFSVSAILDPETKELYHFNYPKELESGYYLTEVIWNGIINYHLFQISDLVVYTAPEQQEYVIWLNNVQTGLPEAGATILAGDIRTKTKENGLAIISPEFSNHEPYTYLHIEAENTIPLLLCIPSPTEDTTATDYYHYIYTDSPSYCKQDTMNIWGCITKRNETAPSPDAFLLLNDKDRYPVSIDSAGAFEAYIPLHMYQLGEYTLDLYINNKKCQSQSFRIIDSEDTCEINAITTKNAYFENETATFSLHVGYKNGIGVPKASVTSPDQTALTTDMNGNVTYAKPLSYISENSLDNLTTTVPAVQNFSFTVNGQNTPVTEKVPLLIFKNDQYLKGNAKKLSPNTCSLEIETNQIDFQKINQFTKAEFKEFITDIKIDEILGDAVEKDVTVEIHGITFERTQSGTYYDKQQQKVQLKYNYTEKDTVLRTLQTKTKNGKVVLENMSVPSSDGYRYILLIMKDAAGRDCRTKLYLDNPIISNATNYQFDSNANNDGALQLSIYDASGKKDIQEGAFIYHYYGDTVACDVSQGTEATLSYPEQIYPALNISGAYFDGKQLHSLPVKNIDLFSEQKELNVKIDLPKTQYKPGDTLSFKIEVTDMNGKPVKNAPYNIHVMDTNNIEWAFTKSMWDKIYDPQNNRVTNSCKSALESAAFLCGKTDANGHDEITITLPKQSANWLIYAQCITKNVCIGTAAKEISSHHDIQINIHSVATYKNGDDAVFAFACAEKNNLAQSPMQTEIILLQDSVIKETRILQHVTNQTQYVNWGKLPIGKYQLKIIATLNTQKTEISHEFTIVKENFAIQTISPIAQAPILAQQILLTDEQHNAYTQHLQSLLLSGGTKLDKSLANAYATHLLSDTTTWEENSISLLLQKYAQDNGYAQNSTDKTPNLLLTAQISALFPHEINSAQVEMYFDEILCDEESTYEDVLCALWGKASLGHAVEKDLAYYYAEGNGLTSEQQLLFALAYAYGGNQKTANEIYENRLKTLLYHDDIVAFLPADDPAKAHSLNSMLSMLLCRISSTDAQMVLNYLTDEYPHQVSLERVAYIKEYVPQLEGTNTVCITYEDGEETYDFNRCTPLLLQNSHGEIKKIKQLKGQTAVWATQPQSQSYLNSHMAKAGDISFYMPQECAPGDDIIINISLSPDHIAAGKIQLNFPVFLQYLRRHTASQPNVAINYDEVNQQVIISADNPVNTDIALYCKAILPGEFIMEPAFCLHENATTFFSSQSTLVKVTEQLLVNETEI